MEPDRLLCTQAQNPAVSPRRIFPALFLFFLLETHQRSDLGRLSRMMLRRLRSTNEPAAIDDRSARVQPEPLRCSKQQFQWLSVFDVRRCHPVFRIMAIG